MRLSRFNIMLTALAITVPVILGFTWYRASAHDGNRSVTGVTEAFHITSADGTKSIGQLIRERNGTVPDQAISSFHFIVDPFGDALIFPRVEPFQPAGFQWGILPGQDKKINIPEIPLRGLAALDFFLIRTTGTCNVLVIIEFYPRR